MSRYSSSKRAALLVLAALCVSWPVSAAIDLSDYDNDLMRDLEKVIKYFEPDIAGKNADAAKEDAETLVYGFKYQEAYFTKKGAQDAVELSRKGIQTIAAVLKGIEQNDFDAAAAAAREIPPICKSCHDIYKPRLAR